MQPSKEMKSVISQIGDKHGYKWWSAVPGTILKAELELADTVYYPLVIEKLTETTLRVAHEITTETGEIVCNPEIIFFIGYPEWIAMELHQPYSLITSIGLPDTSIKTVELTSGGRAIKNYEPTNQKNITIFAKAWAKQLKAANWAHLSTDAEFHQTSFNEKGEVEDIVREMDRQLRRDGLSMTVSSGNRSATIGQPQA
jgi:hypothetical protein